MRKEFAMKIALLFDDSGRGYLSIRGNEVKRTGGPSMKRKSRLVKWTLSQKRMKKSPLTCISGGG